MNSRSVSLYISIHTTLNEQHVSSSLYQHNYVLSSVESDGKVEEAMGTDTIWQQRDRASSSILVTSPSSAWSNVGSVVLPKGIFMFLWSNRGSCYYNSRLKAAVYCRAGMKLMVHHPGLWPPNDLFLSQARAREARTFIQIFPFFWAISYERTVVLLRQDCLLENWVDSRACHGMRVFLFFALFSQEEFSRADKALIY